MTASVIAMASAVKIVVPLGRGVDCSKVGFSSSDPLYPAIPKPVPYGCFEPSVKRT